MNDHIKFTAKLAGAKFGDEDDGGEYDGSSSNIPITGDISGMDGIVIEKGDP